MQIENGRIVFHVKFINRSYRIRGKAPRTHKNIILKHVIINGKISISNEEFILKVKNIVVVIILIKIILAYSAINNNAKPPPPYSMLNPDTSSDSPSTKSNGARLVSARQVINHIKNIGLKIKAGAKY